MHCPCTAAVNQNVEQTAQGCRPRAADIVQRNPDRPPRTKPGRRHRAIRRAKQKGQRHQDQNPDPDNTHDCQSAVRDDKRTVHDRTDQPQQDQRGNRHSQTDLKSSDNSACRSQTEGQQQPRPRNHRVRGGGGEKQKPAFKCHLNRPPTGRKANSERLASRVGKLEERHHVGDFLGDQGE